MNKIYYNETNVGIVNYTGGGSADGASAGLSAWQSKYTGISSKIKAIGT